MRAGSLGLDSYVFFAGEIRLRILNPAPALPHVRMPRSSLAFILNTLLQSQFVVTLGWPTRLFWICGLHIISFGIPLRRLRVCIKTFRYTFFGIAWRTLCL